MWIEGRGAADGESDRDCTMVKPDFTQCRLRKFLGRFSLNSKTTGFSLKRATATLFLVILPLVLLVTLLHELSGLRTGIWLSTSRSQAQGPRESSETARKFLSRAHGQNPKRLSDETYPLQRPLNPKTVMSTVFLRESNINASKFDLRRGEIRAYRPHGVAAHFFLQLGTYRSSPRAFSTAGSIQRSFEDWFKPRFQCEWIGSNGTAVRAKEAKKIRPAQSFKGFYDSLIIICHFDEDVGTDGLGGKLYMKYWHQVDKYRTPETFLALVEAPSEYNASMFEPPFAYDIVYCGSPIYGDISPQRVREWVAYHTYVFGNRSHFILYDAGGFHDDVQKVLEPWVKLGRVTVQNIQQIEMYPAYYHHQHTVVNDCLMKSQFLANWTFFFDMDEYLFVEPPHSITKLLEEKTQQDVSVIRYTGKRMSTSMCSLPKANVDNATRDAINSKSV